LVEIIDWQGRQAVKKTVQPTIAEGRIERFDNENYGLKFFAELASNHQDLKLRVPEVYEAGKDYIIIEYLGDDRIITKEMPAEKANERMDLLAKLLAGIDRIKPYGETRYFGNADYRNIRRNFHKWFQRPLAHELITLSQIKRIEMLMDELIPYVQPRITHGDLSPHDHIFCLPDDFLGIVDLEAFTPSGSRYYDAAKCYVRLFSFEESLDVPKQFLKTFINYSEEVENKTEQLMAILVSRTVGMQRDAAVDYEKGNDYRNRAAELLDLVLQNRLELLLP